ncbi:MAG: DUF72 domain-containing protein [Anaeromyxobacter sp.]
MIRYGPAGWDYPDWAGTVYPAAPPRGFDRLAYLARWFATVEINATFYRPYPADVAARWAERVAAQPGFRFGVKLWRRFTHQREPFDADEVAQARAVPDALQAQGRLGAVLLQFPWSFKRDEASLEWLRGLFPALEGLPLVLEVRHASWDEPELLAELEEAGVGIVNLDQPMFRRSLGPAARVTAPVAYVRVHGRNWKDWFRKGAGRDARYDYLYSARELAPWAERDPRHGPLAPGARRVCRDQQPLPRPGRRQRQDARGAGGGPPRGRPDRAGRALRGRAGSLDRAGHDRGRGQVGPRRGPPAVPRTITSRESARGRAFRCWLGHCSSPVHGPHRALHARRGGELQPLHVEGARRREKSWTWSPAPATSSCVCSDTTRSGTASSSAPTA